MVNTQQLQDTAPEGEQEEKKHSGFSPLSYPSVYYEGISMAVPTGKPVIKGAWTMQFRTYRKEQRKGQGGDLRAKGQNWSWNPSFLMSDIVALK